jgi:hypothetical protein
MLHMLCVGPLPSHLKLSLFFQHGITGWGGGTVYRCRTVKFLVAPMSNLALSSSGNFVSWGHIAVIKQTAWNKIINT